MKNGGRPLSVGLSGIALFVLSSTVAFAGDEDLGPHEKTLSIGVTAGVFLPDSDVHQFYYYSNTWEPLNSVGPAMGLRVSYDVLRYLGFELEGEVSPIGTDTTNQGATMLGWRAHVIGQLPGRLTPFFLLGGGTMGVISGDGALGDDNDLTRHVGAGAMFFITPDLSVRLDGRWLLAPKREDVNLDDGSASHFLITSSLSWTFNHHPAPARTPRPDPDGDGVIGDADQCPHDAGVAPDGCPAVADRDNDGILDPTDRCPDQPETINDIDDKDGCPDQVLDQDGDGLSQRVDACPDQAEDMDGFQDHDGCPDPDNDNDDVLDAKDSCPMAAGPVDNRGCPDKDSDGDGLVDRFDNCPTEPGSAHGCRSKQLVVIDQADIKVLGKIYFASSRVAIRSRSNPLLDNLAQVLVAHPEITHVYVEGHTDDEGDATFNKDLSQRRAQAVVEHLTAKGVAANRLEAIGRGEENPIADNSRSRGRAENRRVEFRIERNQARRAEGTR